MGDLQGPKIRINRFAQSPIHLQIGATFALDNSLEKDAGDETQVSTTYAALADDVKAGDILLLTTGKLFSRLMVFPDSGLIPLCVWVVNYPTIKE